MKKDEMDCFLLTNTLRSLVALHTCEKMPVVMLGEVTKDIENFISDYDLTLFVFPPVTRHFCFGHGIDGYQIGQKVFFAPWNPKESRKSVGLDLGMEKFYSDGIASTVEPIKSWSDSKVRKYAKEQGIIYADSQ